jgi:hypothetical protein
MVGGNVRSITVTIRWHEQGQAAELILHEEESGIGSRAERNGELPSDNGKRLPRAASEKSKRKLLPTDRVILDALRKRVPRGDRVTVPVRNGELMEECSISRRQVQICLKRLTGKRLIKRLVNETDIGSHTGYRYLLF